MVKRNERNLLPEIKFIMDYKYRDNFPTSSIKNLIIRTIGIIHKEFCVGFISFFFDRKKYSSSSSPSYFLFFSGIARVTTVRRKSN